VPSESEGVFVDRSNWLAALLVLLGFCCRAWMAHATFFNADEAWHFSVANQNSLLNAYQASQTLWHPPLLICVLYFWKTLGTSDLVLRLPCVIAGTVFCWVYYKWLEVVFGRAVAWVGLLFAAFLPTMIAMSAELRQYPFLLMFVALSAYFLERAFAADSAGRMLLSSACLWLAMLFHYSAFLFAASMGLYAISRLLWQRISRRVIAAWVVGQAGGIALAGFFYWRQIVKLRAMHAGSEPFRRFGDWYLPQFYYHPPHDHLSFFLFRGTFGIFRFIFAWVVAGHIATLLFFAGATLLLRRRQISEGMLAPRLAGILLLLPFVASWIAVTAGIYPFGRTRHSIFLEMFALAGVSVALVRIAKRRTGPALAIAAGIIVLCQLFGTQPWHDMLPLADSRRENMDRALAFIENKVLPSDVIYVNKPSEFQIAHYLCDQKPVMPDRSVAGFESFECRGRLVVSSFPNDDAVLMETFSTKWREMARAYALRPGSKVWVFAGGWSSGLAAALTSRYPEFSGIQAHSFGHYLQIFPLTVE